MRLKLFLQMITHQKSANHHPLIISPRKKHYNFFNISITKHCLFYSDDSVPLTAVITTPNHAGNMTE